MEPVYSVYSVYCTVHHLHHKHITVQNDTGGKARRHMMLSQVAVRQHGNSLRDLIQYRMRSL